MAGTAGRQPKEVTQRPEAIAAGVITRTRNSTASIASVTCFHHPTPPSRNSRSCLMTMSEASRSSRSRSLAAGTSPSERAYERKTPGIRGSIPSIPRCGIEPIDALLNSVTVYSTTALSRTVVP